MGSLPQKGSPLKMFDAEKYISELDMFGIRLGLERVSELKKLAGDPDRDLKFIHLAGTNGKGSTGAMLECALRNAGYTTGFYSSPHLIDIRERFRVNGRSVERQIFEQETEKLSLLAGDDKFSYFEFTTVLAMQIFKSAGCDFVIWETGMGGRLDATNVVTPEAVVITNIALDHQDHLGSTVAAIAAEKAGIIKKGVPLFYGKLDADARKVICAKAQELGCSIYPPAAEVPEAESIRELDDRFVQEFTYCNDHVVLSLGGRMQRENFRIVHNVLKYLSSKHGFDFARSIASLDKVVWPCRFQKVNFRTIVDGGHNPDGAAALASSLEEFCPGEKFTVIFAAFENKEVGETLDILRSKFAARFIFTRPVPWGRASRSFEDLQSNAGDTSCCWCDDAVAALRKAEAFDERILVCGSLYLAGSVLSELKTPEAACDLV